MRRWDRLRNQLPMLAVLLVSGTGLAAVAIHHWRKGLYVIGAGVVLGAVLRLLLPTRRVASVSSGPTPSPGMRVTRCVLPMRSSAPR